jgi:hypothetical protein
VVEPWDVTCTECEGIARSRIGFGADIRASRCSVKDNPKDQEFALDCHPCKTWLIELRPKWADLNESSHSYDVD